MTALYRLLTGEDSSAFCHKVTDALAKGWVLHGSPAFAWDAGAGVMRCAQAVTKETEADYDPDRRLGEQ
ncbi:DUF1737 domain-containing protein [Jannaschia ovalis]|uniref:DUF1737 domain-containing protein n=1 Tax=Jannaschia ovalis TaxID=3038773 RepID=A0ABY8LFJ6_9RHOB|nr:DUF1737 domain-containing protein [Jannaschia sp. GRR-S6-38]WGH80082.1 DUF1737 domain-containing protein [Jannaschia sp. GRR-S6-38]